MIETRQDAIEKWQAERDRYLELLPDPSAQRQLGEALWQLNTLDDALMQADRAEREFK